MEKPPQPPKRWRVYLPSFLLGLLLLLGYPMSFFIIFLAGDSCCGEDTSGNMRAVAYVLVFLVLILSFLINIIYRAVKKNPPRYNLVVGTLVTWLPSAVVYLSAVEKMIESAFG